MQDKRKDTEEQEPRYTAIHKYAPISAQKVRVFADLIRGKYADEAMTLLECYPNRGARMLEKVLKSAMHNAEDLRAPALDDLRVAEVRVDGGPMQRRFRPGSRGASRIFVHRSSHISVVLK
ncbi:MAG: 50S ribosomal protein L22 [Thermoguttaceae bacterium]|nr:50S ribosomal protein L22 [Thermoguttaceae bacterium]